MTAVDILHKFETQVTEALTAIGTTGAEAATNAGETVKKIGQSLIDFGTALATVNPVPAPVPGTVPNPAPTDPNAPNVPMGAAQPDRGAMACCDRLEKLKEQCRQRTAVQPGGPAGSHLPAAGGNIPMGAVGGPVMDAVLAQLVAAAIDIATTWFRKRFPQPTA